MKFKNIIETIGNTPLVRISNLNPNPDVDMYAKIEGFNPTGSIKDRIALKMIEQAEQSGRLRKGITIMEPTSGNTGIGLAVIAAINAAKRTGKGTIVVIFPDRGEKYLSTDLFKTSPDAA